MPTNFEGNPLRLFACGRLSFLPWGLGPPPLDYSPRCTTAPPLKMPLVRSKKPSQIPSPALLGIFFTNFSINLLLLSSSLEARAQKISNSARWGDCIYVHTLHLKRHTILLRLPVSFLVRFLVSLSLDGRAARYFARLFSDTRPPARRPQPPTASAS